MLNLHYRQLIHIRHWQVLVIGDSHIMRLAGYACDYFADRQIDMSYRFNDSIAMDALFFQPNRQYDLIMFAVGANDLVNPNASAQDLLSTMVYYAEQYVKSGWCKRVLIMSLWPKVEHAINDDYNKKAKEFNAIGSTLEHSNITFWFWSDRLTIKHSPDGYHLTPQSYCCAVRYLASPIFFLNKNHKAYLNSPYIPSKCDQFWNVE